MRCSIVIVFAGWMFLAASALAQVPLETDAVDKDYADELVRTAPKAPREALATFRLPSGFRIEVAASEPLVQDPVAMAFDSWGRMYVVEMRGYSEQPEESLGRVRRLEDRDQDGHFETVTDFLTGLSWPTAIACFDDGIILGQPPHLQYCRDQNGDGRADEVVTWATGFGRQNVQGMMNSFVWGLDGRLYGSASSNGGELTGAIVVASPLSLRRRDFAIQFGEQIELQPVSGGGQHGMSFDDLGNRYVSSNSDHLQWVEYEERYQGRNPYLIPLAAARSIAADGPAAEVYRTSPVEPWREVRTRLRVKGFVSGPIEGGGRAAGYFTGATGVTIYRGDTFADTFRQRTHAFVGDVGGNLVHHKVIESHGLKKVAYRVEATSEFLTSTDNWFRPCQFANGPDGALYVVDMYRETIEHPASLPPTIKRHLDLTSGRDRGRIYRVVTSDFRREPRTMPGDVDGEALVAMLSHPNGWHRDTAMHRLLGLARGTNRSRIPALAAHLEDLVRDSGDAQGIVRALYCLDTWRALDGGVLRKALGHPAALVRVQAVRLAEARFLDPEVLAAVQALANDQDLGVRFQVAMSLGEAEAKRRVEPLRAAGSSGRQRCQDAPCHPLFTQPGLGCDGGSPAIRTTTARAARLCRTYPRSHAASRGQWSGLLRGAGDRAARGWRQRPLGGVAAGRRAATRRRAGRLSEAGRRGATRCSRPHSTGTFKRGGWERSGCRGDAHCRNRGFIHGPFRIRGRDARRTLAATSPFADTDSRHASGS